MARLRTLVLGCCIALAGACGDDDGGDDDTPADAGDAGRDGGGTTSDGGRDAGLDAAADGGSIDGGGDASSLMDARVNDGSLGDASVSPLTSFFVTSDTSATGNLGGITGADMRCQRLAAAVGLGSKTWRAFLSLESDPTRDGGATEARSRIGAGPWYNAKGQLVANDAATLLTLNGNADLFVDERGSKINGQWPGSPTPNQHDILTGTELDGGVAVGATCSNWTSDSDAGVKLVGHSDGLGPMMNPNPPYNSWFSSHRSPGCHTTLPQGGAGKIYCFATTQ
jgi:hypothetical protein